MANAENDTTNPLIQPPPPAPLPTTVGLCIFCTQYIFTYTIHLGGFKKEFYLQFLKLI